MNYLVVFTIVLLLIYTIEKAKKAMHMLQQNLYNVGNRYLKWIRRNGKEVWQNFDFFSCLLLVFVFLFPNSFLLFLTAASYFIGIFLLYQKEKGEKGKTKKPLVITARVKRLIVTMSLLYGIFVFLCFFRSSETFLWLLVLGCMTYFVYFVLWFANILNFPVEKCVYYKFYFQATKKLKKMEQLKVIGITGSYGKTSCKNILSDILNVKMVAHPSPKNLNTEYGLMITINNHIDKFDDVFIAEMGAYKRGEIDTLCKLVHPKYGILTTIGLAHLESFESEENIQKTKFELIESLPRDGVAILNGDDPKQLSYPIRNDCKKIWVGIRNKNVDVSADPIQCSKDGSRFDCHFRGIEESYSFETRLLGNHNIYNLLSAIALAKELGMSMDEIKMGVRKVKPIEHRLEIKKVSNFYMIDDAYNSNPVGAEMAVDVLAMMPGTKVVVTPGMIELGEKEKEANETFGTQIAKVADYVILIGEKQTKPIYEGLMKSGFDSKKIYILSDVKESFPLVSRLKEEKEVYALYENDLPDSYNEKDHKEKK